MCSSSIVACHMSERKQSHFVLDQSYSYLEIKQYHGETMIVSGRLKRGLRLLHEWKAIYGIQQQTTCQDLTVQLKQAT